MLGKDPTHTPAGQKGPPNHTQALLAPPSLLSLCHLALVAS